MHPHRARDGKVGITQQDVQSNMLPFKKKIPRPRMLDTIKDATRSPLLIEIEMLILSFATGIQDAATYPDYQCFASNQTGNTVMLAVGVAGIGGDLFHIQNISISLGVFVAGCYIMGQIGNVVGSRRRLWILFSNIIQTVLVFAAMAIQWRVKMTTSGPAAWGVIALLAFSSAGQVALARPLNIPQITTAMATAAFVDLFVDPDFHKLRNRVRNRRFLFLAMLAAGSFVGAFSVAGLDSGYALLLCAICKTVVTILFLFNEAEQKEACDVVEKGVLEKSLEN